MYDWSSEEEDDDEEVVVPPSPALPRLPTLPWEVLRNVFEYFLDNEYDHEEGESTLWPIHWREEKNDGGSDILVPYAVVREGSPIGKKRREDIKRRGRFWDSDADTRGSVNPLLSICRETRVMALDPTKGRYASLPVVWTEYHTRIENEDTEAVTGAYVLVHPHRAVFLFSDLLEDPPVSNTYDISLHDGATLSVEQIAQILHDEDPPYGLDMELLRAAAVRTGFHFRHILFMDNLDFQVDTHSEVSLNSWVLVHICENTDLRAHLFDIFLPCNVGELSE